MFPTSILAPALGMPPSAGGGRACHSDRPSLITLSASVFSSSWRTHICRAPLRTLPDSPLPVRTGRGESGRVLKGALQICVRHDEENTDADKVMRDGRSEWQALPPPAEGGMPRAGARMEVGNMVTGFDYLSQD